MFYQAAIPQIFEKTKEDFFLKIINIMREAADVFHEKTKEIPCVTCPHKPDGSMFAMVRTNQSRTQFWPERKFSLVVRFLMTHICYR